MGVTQGGLGGCFEWGPGRARTISDMRSVRVCSTSRRRVAKYLKRRQQNLCDREGGRGGPGKATREETAAIRWGSE